MTRDTDSPISSEAGAALRENAQQDVRIPMPDGVELSATLYLPDPESWPQPCIVEALPYRKDDLTSTYAPEYVRLRDRHGYAVCRIDLRGTGSSGGDAVDEYPPQEQRDLAVAMTWLAEQEWCDGSIGMYGTSYSGFNSLQMACERPPELKAVIAIYATDDRYTDDVHYRGGALKFVDLVDYNHYMTAMNALPPVPAVWGPDWRAEWRRRIEVNEPWLLTWLREQVDGPYWRHGSVRPDYDRIACPTMIIAGWADGYRNNSFRMIERLREQNVPHHLLAGPWAHASTDNSLPGPRIDSLPLMTAWWDRWLRGKAPGPGDALDLQSAAPAATVFVRTSTRPAPDLDVSEGFWIREDWPCPRSEGRELTLSERPSLQVNPAVGVDAWIDCAGHLPWGQSGDQRFDDAASMTWEFDADGLTLLGHPTARLRISADAAVAYASVKLCDVFPDGTSALVARGSLNLTHRRGHTAPIALEPGEPVDVDVELDACAYQFAPGQRLRLSIAGADWPNTAAPPQPVTLTVHGGILQLPVWRGPSPHPEPKLPPPTSAESGESAEGVTWAVERDVLARTTRCVVDHGSSYDVPHDGAATERYRGTVSVDHQTYVQRAQAEAEYAIQWPTATVSTTAVLDLTADADAYRVSITLEARENGDLVATREWREAVERDLA